MLAQQLLAAGEQVLDVQPKLGARVRLLSSGTSNKNDPNDTRSVTVAVRASGTTLTEVFGVGPVIAAAFIGDVADISRFPTADRFASYNGTAPIEVSSGSRKIYRLSMRGNRRLNHAIHMAAVTQIAHKHSDGHAYYQRKLAEGKTPSEARRALKRKISNAIYARLQADAHPRGNPGRKGPGGQPGNDSASSAASSHPERRLLGQATPEPATTLRPTARPSTKKPFHDITTSHLTNKRDSDWRKPALPIALFRLRPTLPDGTGSACT